MTPCNYKDQTLDELKHSLEIEKRRLLGLRWNDRQFRRETDKRILQIEKLIAAKTV